MVHGLGENFKKTIYIILLTPNHQERIIDFDDRASFYAQLKNAAAEKGANSRDMNVTNHLSSIVRLEYWMTLSARRIPKKVLATKRCGHTQMTL